MLTLYTAVGILRFEDCLKNHKTPMEKVVLQIAKRVQISTAELAACVEHGVFPKDNRQLLSQLYDSTDATFHTVAENLQLNHTQYPILEAVTNLYLNKQIAFEKL